MFGPQYSAAQRRYIPDPDPSFSEKVRGQMADPETRKLLFNVAFFVDITFRVSYVQCASYHQIISTNILHFSQVTLYMYFILGAFNGYKGNLDNNNNINSCIGCIS
ncbi:hypothetical protein U3516DRAFT_732293 [Neocallimastix sp. 'constans']